MRYLPESKPGFAIAAAYLLVIFGLRAVGLNGGCGHGNPAPLLVGLVLILTFPTSWLATETLDYLNPAPPAYTSGEQISTFAVFAVCAVINAAIIYFLVKLAGRAFRRFLISR
jgi:hypothetical protein